MLWITQFHLDVIVYAWNVRCAKHKINGIRDWLQEKNDHFVVFTGFKCVPRLKSKQLKNERKKQTTTNRITTDRKHKKYYHDETQHRSQMDKIFVGNFFSILDNLLPTTVSFCLVLNFAASYTQTHTFESHPNQNSHVSQLTHNTNVMW